MSLSSLSGKGWLDAEPPESDDPESVIARVNNNCIKAGLVTEIIEDNNTKMHYKYRTGVYDIEMKLELDTAFGQVRIEKSDDYE